VDIDLLGVLMARRRQGRLTLVELNDNFLEPRAFGEVGAFYHQPAQAALVLQLAHWADGLIVSTPYLAQLFGHLNSRLLVLPNALDVVRPLPSQRLGPKPRLGWAGSSGHRPDLIAVMPALRQLMGQHAALTLCIMAPADLHDLFAWVPKNRLDLRPSTHLDGYLDFIATWDVGVAPLTDIPFNRGRSDVKFLEYASMGVPVVASAGPAYHTLEDGKTGLLAQTPEAFVGQVSRLLTDGSLHAAMRAQAWDYVAHKRRLSGASAALGRFVTEALGSRRTAAPSPSARWHARLTAGRDVPGKTASYLSFTAGERHLYEGLRQHQRGQSGAQHLAAAQALQPAFYLPHLLRGALCPQPDQALQHLQVARRLAPHSVAAAYHLGRALMQAGHAHEALTVLAEAAKADGGSYAPLHELVAQGHGQLGDADAERRALDRAIEANRWYGGPAVTLAARAVRDAEAAGPTPARSGHLEAHLDRAHAALHKTSAGPLCSWQDLFWLGRLEGVRGRWARAQPHLEQALQMAEKRQEGQGAQLCLAYLAKAALALGDARQARAYLVRSRSHPTGSTANNAPR
jgi:tetratricopeptide (TPR) repeat protein